MDGADQGPGGEFARARALLPEAVVSAVGYRSALPGPALHRGAPSPAVTLVFSLDEPIVTGSTPQQAFGDEAHTRLRAAGVEMIRDVEDREYGNRELTIRDPEGNLWSFGYYRGEPRG